MARRMEEDEKQAFVAGSGGRAAVYDTFLHRYELEWMCWVQMLICIIVGIKVLDHLRAFYEDRRMIGKK